MSEEITTIQVKAETYKKIRKYYEKAKEEKRTVNFDEVISGILSKVSITEAMPGILRSSKKMEEK